MILLPFSMDVRREGGGARGPLLIVASIIAIHAQPAVRHARQYLRLVPRLRFAAGVLSGPSQTALLPAGPELKRSCHLPVIGGDASGLALFEILNRLLDVADGLLHLAGNLF